MESDKPVPFDEKIFPNRFPFYDQKYKLNGGSELITA